MEIIQNIESLEHKLEQGLGHVYKGGLFSLPPELRLRMGVCGIASIAVQEILRDEGVSSQLLLSRPELPVDETMDHVFVMTDDIIIDPTYSQFVQYAGVLPYDVARGDADDIYPERKIEQFNFHEPQRVVRNLARAAERALSFRPTYDHYDLRNFTPPAFEGLSLDDMSTMLERVWSPTYFSDYDPTVRTKHEGLRLAQYVRDL